MSSRAAVERGARLSIGSARWLLGPADEWPLTRLLCWLVRPSLAEQKAPRPTGPFARISPIQMLGANQAVLVVCPTHRGRLSLRTAGAGNSRTFWRLRKHPAQIQSRLQSDGSGGKITRLFDRAVERMNGDSPGILFALLRRQFTVQSNGVS